MSAMVERQEGGRETRKKERVEREMGWEESMKIRVQKGKGIVDTQSSNAFLGFAGLKGKKVGKEREGGADGYGHRADERRRQSAVSLGQAVRGR